MKPKSNIVYNKICLKCVNKCKQTDKTLLLQCPKFEAKLEQLEIPLKMPRRKRKKA